MRLSHRAKAVQGPNLFGFHVFMCSFVRLFAVSPKYFAVSAELLQP